MNMIKVIIVGTQTDPELAHRVIQANHELGCSVMVVGRDDQFADKFKDILRDIKMDIRPVVIEFEKPKSKYHK